MMSVSRILVPVDFSPCSDAAVEYAIELGSRFGAPIDVLHVWSPPAYQASDPFGVPSPAFAEFSHSIDGTRMRELLAMIEAHTSQDVRGRLETGHPADTIVDVARSDRYDLIVMGTHGHTGLAHLLLGGTAEKVVRHAPCPVLTIRLPHAPVTDALGSAKTHVAQNATAPFATR